MSISIEQVPAIARRNRRCGINFTLHSRPSMAKTAVLTQIAAQLQALPPKDPNHIDLFSVWNGGSLTPLDLSATIPNLTTMTLDRVHFNALPNFYDTPELTGIIYIGERGLVGLESDRQLQKIVNHEDFGDHKKPMRIPPGIIFAGDSNLITDKSGVQAHSRAVDNRFEHYVLRWDAEPYLRYAMGHFHPKLGAFLKRHMQNLDNYEEVFNPKQEANSVIAVEGKHGIWACMRTWDRLSRKMFDVDKYNEQLMTEEVHCVGVGMAAKFNTHLTMLSHLASIEEVVANPKKADVPTAIESQFGMSYMLSLMVKSDTFRPVSVYMRRLPTELQVQFLVAMNDRYVGEAKSALDAQVSKDAQKIFDSQEYVDWSEDPKIGGPLVEQLTR